MGQIVLTQIIIRIIFYYVLQTNHFLMFSIEMCK